MIVAWHHLHHPFFHTPAAFFCPTRLHFRYSGLLPYTFHHQVRSCNYIPVYQYICTSRGQQCRHRLHTCAHGQPLMQEYAISGTVISRAGYTAFTCFCGLRVYWTLDKLLYSMREFSRPAFQKLEVKSGDCYHQRCCGSDRPRLLCIEHEWPQRSISHPLLPRNC